MRRRIYLEDPLERAVDDARRRARGALEFFLGVVTLCALIYLLEPACPGTPLGSFIRSTWEVVGLVSLFSFVPLAGLHLHWAVRSRPRSPAVGRSLYAVSLGLFTLTALGFIQVVFVGTGPTCPLLTH